MRDAETFGTGTRRPGFSFDAGKDDGGHGRDKASKSGLTAARFWPLRPIRKER